MLQFPGDHAGTSRRQGGPDRLSHPRGTSEGKPRGGLFPAAVLARELEIRWIDTICVASYDEESRDSKASILKIPEGDGEGVLVVDDLVDSGRTGRIIRELMPKAYFVTMYAKPKGQEVVDDFVVPVDQDVWILFPWEAELSPASPLRRRL